MIDYAAIALIGVFAFLGFFRGVLSQVMSILGFVGVFLFAKTFSEKLNPSVIEYLGSPKPYAKAIALIWAAFIIYVGCRLLGFFIEKLIIRKSSALKSANRFGGGLLGLVKGTCIVIVIFYILYLIPAQALEKSAPKVRQSKIYQLMNQYPIFDRSFAEGLMAPISQSTQQQIQSIMKSEDPAFVKQIEKEQRKESKMNEKELLKELDSHLTPNSKKAEKK